MKKLFTFILMISTLICYSQNPKTFVDQNATWNVAKTYLNSNPQNPSFVETITNIFGFNGDTIIGGQTWMKFYSTIDSNFIYDLVYQGNLIEENGIILFNDAPDSIDTLYNFNLLVGDSVNYHFGFGTEYLSIESIDSIEINGEYLKRYHFEELIFQPYALNEIWIEGIGSIHGPLFPKYPTLFSTEIPDSLNLTCYKINNSIIWNNPSYEDCYISIILSSKEIEVGQLVIFPNPVENELSVEIPSNDSKEFVISIYDLLGNKIMMNRYNQERTLKINTTYLKNSVYILQIENDNEVYRQKFIKQ